MTTSEAINVFKEYLTTKIVPRPMELIEASKIAIKVLTQQLEETDKQSHWKPSEEQMSMLLAVINDPNNAGAESCYMALKSIYNNLKKL